MTTLPFHFQSPANLRFGRGTARAALPEIAALGTRVLLVHGANASRAEWLRDGFADKGCAVTSLSCVQEPGLEDLEDGLEQGRAAQATVVVALGGGSVIDLGKALAALIPGSGVPMDHLEVVGRGLPLSAAPLAFAALPSTAGTGAEMTKNAVIGVPEHRRKVSLRDPRMVADLAVVDPALTDHTPRDVTLASGLDAITQVIEPYLCTRANLMTDALCQQSIPMGLQALVRLMEAEDPGARDALAYTSLCGGLALSNAGLGAVHGFAGVLGGVTSAPHGAICGALLPHVLTANRTALPKGAAVLARFDWVAAQIGSALKVSGATAFEALEEWSHANGLLRLSQMGLGAEAHADVAAEALKSSSMKANPVELSPAALGAILQRAG